MKRKILTIGAGLIAHHGIMAAIKEHDMDIVILSGVGATKSQTITDKENDKIKMDEFLDFCGEIAAAEMQDMLKVDAAIFKDPGPKWNSNGKAKKRPFKGSSR